MCGGLIVTDAQLQPQHLRADGNGFFGNGRHIFRTAKDIYDVDLLACLLCLRQRGIDTPAQNRLLGVAWIDGDDVVSLGLQVDRHKMAGTILVGGDADDGNVAVPLDDAQAIVHIGACFNCHVVIYLSICWLSVGSRSGRDSSRPYNTSIMKTGEGRPPGSKTSPGGGPKGVRPRPSGALREWSRSHKMSSIFSIPIDTRIRSGVTPPASWSSSESCWCVVLAG